MHMTNTAREATSAMHSRRQLRQKLWNSVEAKSAGVDEVSGGVADAFVPEASRWANAITNGLAANVEHRCTRSKPLAPGPEPCRYHAFEFKPSCLNWTDDGLIEQTQHSSGGRASGECPKGTPANSSSTKPANQPENSLQPEIVKIVSLGTMHGHGKSDLSTRRHVSFVQP